MQKAGFFLVSPYSSKENQVTEVNTREPLPMLVVLLREEKYFLKLTNMIWAPLLCGKECIFMPIMPILVILEMVIFSEFFIFFVNYV